MRIGSCPRERDRERSSTSRLFSETTDGRHQMKTMQTHIGAKRKQGGATKGDAGTPANLRESEKRTSSMLPLIGFDPIDKQTEGPRSPSGKSEDKES